MNANENKFAVVFDTNSYRQFVNGKSNKEVIEAVSELRIAEAKKNIQAYGINVVGMEMLGNLAEGESGFNYKDCMNGVIAMGNHCFDDSLNAPRIIPKPYLHITRCFFDVIPPEAEMEAKNMGGAINDFKVDYLKAIEHHKKVSTFENIKKFIDHEEDKFSTDIINLIEGAKQEIINKHPRIAPKQLKEKLLDFIEKKFEPFNAMVIIYAVAITLKLQLTQDELVRKAFSMNLEFPLSVGFYRWISYKIVRDKIDMQSNPSKQKRWNWLWDYQVSFIMSEHTLDNRDVILVTSDGDMTKMLNEFGYENKVLTISQYLDYLKH